MAWPKKKPVKPCIETQTAIKLLESAYSESTYVAKGKLTDNQLKSAREFYARRGMRVISVPSSRGIAGYELTKVV